MALQQLHALAFVAEDPAVLCVREGEEAATNSEGSEGAVCNHDPTKLLVSARFEAWIAPTRTWRALAVLVCFSARLLHFVRRVSCHAQL